MKLKSSEFPEDQELTEAAVLVIVLLPLDEVSHAQSSDRPRRAVRTSEERTAVQASLGAPHAAVRPRGD
jgi:hypothetical protein